MIKLRFLTLLVLLARESEAFTQKSTTTTTTTTMRPCRSQLYMSVEPLAKKGDWGAYLDEEGTGLIYYFNVKTGESLWEPPVDDFPEVSLTPGMKAKAKVKQEEYVKILEEEEEAKKKNGRGFLSTLLEDSSSSTSRTTSSSAGRGDWFQSVFEDVIKPKEEAEQAAAAAAAAAKETPVTQAKPKNQPSAGQMSRDFFDRMFSGGRNAFSSTLGSSTTAEQSVTSTSSDVIDEEAEQTQQQQQQRPITINSASYVLPHPAKRAWGGEDAVFIQGSTFGVFDGVSGAEKVDGVPLYSKTLAEFMKNNVPTDKGLTLPQIQKTLLDAAEIADEKATGASTAVVASITQDGFLRILNLGDSTCIVVRDGRLVGKTREISHYFECPYQLSIDSPDRPRDGTKLNIELQRGDVVFMASDGIFDNLADEEVVSIINSTLESSAVASSSSGNNNNNNNINVLDVVAKKVADRSRKVSLDPKSQTPYAQQAQKYGDPDYEDGVGGKVDDVSCVVVRYE